MFASFMEIYNEVTTYCSIFFRKASLTSFFFLSDIRNSQIC